MSYAAIRTFAEDIRTNTETLSLKLFVASPTFDSVNPLKRVNHERSTDMIGKPNVIAGMRTRAVMSAIGFTHLAISPAFADMPNPNVQGWTVHQQPPAKFGSDLESQHYATAAITAPDGSGVVSAEMTCENGRRGSNFTVWFSVHFRHGDTVLATTTRHCQLYRDAWAFRHEKDSRTTVVDLSKILDQVDNVQTHLTLGSQRFLCRGDSHPR